MNNTVKLLLAAAAGFALAKLTCGYCGYTDTTGTTANDTQPPLPVESEIRGISPYGVKNMQALNMLNKSIDPNGIPYATQLFQLQMPGRIGQTMTPVNNQWTGGILV